MLQLQLNPRIEIKANFLVKQAKQKSQTNHFTNH